MSKDISHIKIDQSVIDDLKDNHNVDALAEIRNALHKPPEEVEFIITNNGGSNESKSV